MDDGGGHGEDGDRRRPGEPREPGELRAGLRLEVVALRSRGRGLPAPELHAGVPGGPRETFAPGPDVVLDHALRTEVAGALLGVALRRSPAPALWLTRGRVPEWHDEDAAWLGPAVTAYAELGLAPRFLVVTPVGWYDPRTGRGRVWRRPRVRR